MSLHPDANELPPEPIQTLPPSLVSTLRERTQAVLTYLVKTNSVSAFFNESEPLFNFRNAVQLDHGLNITFETFHANVPLTVYEQYRPIISRLFEKPCRMESIENLMSRGFPEFIAHSSGTSSGVTKYFPKYRHPDHMSTSSSGNMKSSDPVSSKTGGKNCIVCSLRHMKVVESMDDDGNIKLKMPVCLVSTGTARMFNGMHIDRDPLYHQVKIPNHSSPLGVSFIPDYKSFLFMHALFALHEPKVELINTIFSTLFNDFCRIIEDQWDLLVESIETGTIPDLNTIGDLKDRLLNFFSANPQRAAELRKIREKGPSPGLLTRIWPGLRVVIAISSGPFQTLIPEIRYYIGPDVELRSLGINSSEAFLGLEYDFRDPNLYKVVGSDDIIEFLPMDAPEESKNLAQAWNVETGKRYEVVLTTRDGLWRYRLGDVIEVTGFDPRDGQPVIRYVERRGVYIRLANEIVTGQELLDAVHSTSGAVSELCVSPDYRETIPRYCFFVEPCGDHDAFASTISGELHTYLKTHNENYLRETQTGKVAPPIVRVLRQGTFGEYRTWVLQKTGMAAGQVKVPLVTWDEEVRNWLGERVVQEFQVQVP